MRFRTTIVVALVLLAACGDDDDASTPDTSSSTTAPTDEAVDAATLCADAVAAEDVVTVANPDLSEASGLAASRQNDGVLWTHNDSGGEAEVYALGLDGADLGSVRLEGVEAVDWEDMAAGPDQLYLGDIGDNDAQRDSVVVYRIAEPEVPPTGIGATTATDVERLTLTYADGPHDAETLLADPLTGDLFVVTKQWDGTASGVYRIPADAPPGDTPVVMERVGDVPGVDGQMATAGDVAADGSLAAVRTYAGVLVWDREDGQSVADALEGEPCEAPAPFELQGEALALTPDGRGYVTVPEGEAPRLSRFHL